MYMPTHAEDIRFIPIIKQTITQQITTHPNYTHILCGDFNRDIALIGRQTNYNITPPQTEDIEWRTFIDSIHLTYTPTNNIYSRQGGHNYTQTSLIDGYYIKTPDNTLYTSTINNDHNLNSDHSPVTLHIPPNTLLARPTPPTTNNTKRILNPIPQENIETFKTKFYDENTLQINELTNILLNDQLDINQWQLACTTLDQLIQEISNIIQETCSAPPLPTFTNRTSQQGGFLPRKTQKQWKKHLTTYHLIRKIIYLANHSINWQTHPIIETLMNHTHANIPPLPIQEIDQQEWLVTIAAIAKTANTQARTITTKFTRDCIRKAIAKYRQLYKKTQNEYIKKSSTTKKHHH